MYEPVACVLNRVSETEYFIVVFIFRKIFTLLIIMTVCMQMLEKQHSPCRVYRICIYVRANVDASECVCLCVFLAGLCCALRKAAFDVSNVNNKL